jgi:hypothetical protein
MSAEGKWQIVIDSPMGKQTVKLDLHENGDQLTGTADQGGNVTELVDGKVDGDNLSWTLNVTRPMPMALAFTTAVTGDEMNGSVKAGAFGSFKVSGQRE